MAQRPYSRRKWRRYFAPAALCIYTVGFSAPLEFDLPLLLLAALGCLAAALNYRQTDPVGSPLHKAVILFLVAGALSVLFSSDPRRSFTLSLALLPGMAIFFLAADYLADEDMLKAVLFSHTLLALGMGAVLLSTLWGSNFAVHPGYENWMGKIGSPLFIVSNDAIFLALLAPLSAAVLLTASSRGQKIIAASSLTLTAILTGLMQSRLMAAMLLITATTLAFLIRPRLAVPASLATLAVVSLLDAVRGFPLYSRFLAMHGSNGTQWWDARIPIWETGWKMFLEKPLLGEGVHTFRYVSVDNIQVNWAHNLYLETLAEQGILGFLTLCGLLGMMLWMAIHNTVRATGEQRMIAAALLAAIAGIFFGGIFEMSFVRQWVNEIVFFTAGATAFLNRRLQKSSE